MNVVGGYWLRVAAVSLTAAVLVTALFAAGGRTTSIPATLRHALVHSVVMAALAGGSVPWIRRRLEAFGATVQWGGTLAAMLGVAGVGTALSCGAITAIEAGAHDPFWVCFAAALPINALLAMVICTGMTLYESQRARLDALTLTLRTRELEHERVVKMALQARLASLESRLQPHFLFNTLNAISALIQEDPEQAERTLERLAALLRFSLDASERGLVPLDDELKIVTDYLEIERTRLGERLAYAFDVSADSVRCEVPPLTLQTLVENSVKHSIAPRRGGGRIRVDVAIVGGQLVLGVWDDGSGATSPVIRPGHGLENLKARLAARFGPAAALTFDRREAGTLVSVTLPARGKTR